MLSVFSDSPAPGSLCQFIITSPGKVGGSDATKQFGQLQSILLRQHGPNKTLATTSAQNSQHGHHLGAAEQKLHVLGRQLLHGSLVLVDCAVDHVCFLLLQHDHA
jgi:hypothetical protein